ncbi:unnamed protein product [Rhizophagus irregularis]|nr:unnamed protein product [Rhizophagus irregularis]CAB5197272.1 unnamed protein product [Rhizophagus irregularis]
MVECLIIFAGNFSNNFEIYLWKKNFFGEMRYFIMRQNGSDLKPEKPFQSPNHLWDSLKNSEFLRNIL